MNRRIKLKEGMQKQLIDKAKCRTDLSWNKLSRLLNISPSYLRIDLRYERRLLPEEIYLKLCKLTNLDYNEYILENFARNWGQIKGGKLSEHKEKKPNLLTDHYSTELAEAIGIMLGDGNIWENKGFIM